MMKMNKWTMALAAAGVVSLSSVAQAQEAAGGAEALAASTTVSGYISTSYTAMSDNGHGKTFRESTNDKFALDVVSLSISNGDLGSDTGSAAYNLELWLGPAASDINTGDDGTNGDVALMEANIELLASFGEQDVKLTVGQFGTTVGAETYSYGDDADGNPVNAFHQRSVGFAIEPTHHTGVKAETTLGGLDVTLGIANSNQSAQTNNGQGSNALLTGVSHTLGSGTGWFEGTTLTYGGVHDAEVSATAEATNHYFGLTKEIVTGLTYSLAWDIREEDDAADSNIVGHYLSYPLGGGTLNVRFEHGNVNAIDLDADGTDENADGLESLSVGYDYPIWTGVTSRVEFRQDDWDNKTNGSNESFAINLVYNF